MQAASNVALCEALLDFAATPGRHALRLREPALLFDELDLVALWALGRVPEGLNETQAVRQAALLFVLRACFSPGLSHYQLLGLSPAFTAGQLRARYRALIRLTHPDMGIEGLPVGAAGMVNRAHAVLADEAQRAMYDRQLFAQLPSAAALPTDAGQDAGRVGAVKLGRTDLAWGGSRWSLFRHVASMQVLRVALTGGVLLVAAALALAWAMRGTGNQSRLVAQESVVDVGAAKPGAAEPAEMVRLRIPVQWSNGIDVPVARVPVPSASVNGRPAATTVAAGSAVPALASAAVAPVAPVATPTSVASPAPVSAPAPAPAPVSESAPSPAPSFLASLTSAFRASPAKPEEVAAASASAAVKPALASAPASASASASASAPAPVPAPAPALKTASSTASAPTLASSLASASTPPAKAAPAAVQASAAAPGPRWPSAKTDTTPSVALNADGPAVAGRNMVWDVDVPSARIYLQDLLNQLAQPEQARSTSHALEQMNVNGSLLMPPGVVGDVMRPVQIERADLSESHRPGVLRIRGVMKAQVSSYNTPPRAVRLRVQAEFKGTAQGTVLTLLDLFASR
jgi:hypothetical protein